MKRIRAGSGLGDSLYLRPIAEHFVRAGEAVTVCSDYPDVFIGSGANVEPFRRDRVDVIAHYTAGKSDTRTTQFADMLRAAGIAVEVPLQFGWPVKNHTLVDQIFTLANGRPIVIAHGGRAPMARTDGFGAELLPQQRAFNAALAALPDCFLVGIGKQTAVGYPLPVDIDLNDQTSVSDILDIAVSCAGVVAQCSFAVPLAEIFGKPMLAIWSARGLASPQPYIRTITPQKVLSRPTSTFVMDDWSAAEIQGGAHAFYRLL